MHVGADPRAEPGSFDNSFRVTVQIRNSKLDAPLGEPTPYVVERGDRAGVKDVDRAGIEDEPVRRGGQAIDDIEDAMLDVVGIEEHQAGLYEVDGKPLHRPGV